VNPTPQPATAAREPSTSLVQAAVNTWLRYLVPLTLLSAIALSPIIVIALRVRAPVDQAAANAVVATGWTMLAVAWLGQLLLVGGAAAVIRSPPSPPAPSSRPPPSSPPPPPSSPPPLSQLEAFSAGFANLVRAIVPCLAAAIAIAIGSLALVVPGLALLALLALTGASRAHGLPAALADSISVARKHLPAIALTVAAMLALDAAIGLAAYRAFVVPLPRQPAPAQLAAVRHFVRAIAIALIVVSPLPATVLATIRARAE
jgi:hypothetical protein